MTSTDTGTGTGTDPSVARGDPARLFRDTFGAEPDGVWSAPGRVNLIGEHTDYNGGLCLPIALPHRTYAAVRRRDDRHLRIVSAQGEGVVELDLDDVGPGSPSGWAAYVAGVPWALERAGHTVGGFDVAVDGRVPLGAGLSSSAAIECAVAVALADVFSLGLADTHEGRVALAAVCVEAENTVAQAPTGGMDQSASLLGREGHALLLDCLDFSTEQVPFDLDDHRLALLVVDTRAVHELVDGQYAERRDSCEQAARELGVSTLREVSPDGLDETLGRLSTDLLRKRTKHIVTEIARVEQAREALRANDFERLGELFLASHDSMRDDFEISVAELDTVVTSATAAGALGARMTGGGFGGSAIALVRRDEAGTVQTAVEKAFADSGFDRAPECFVVSAAGPAGRDL